MRLTLTALLGAASLLPAVLGTPVIYVRNFCPYTVYWWHVGQGGIDGSGELWTGGNEPQGEIEWTVDDAPGQAFKITREADGLWTGAPVTVFGYTAVISSQTLW
jgi:hypothetical protein